MGQAGRLSEKIREIYEKESWLKFLDAFSFGATSFLNGIRRRLGLKEFCREEPVGVRAVKPGYIETYIKQYIASELPFTFVYGHTHKKQEEKEKEPLEVLGHRCPTLNTGAWMAKDKEDRDNNGFFVINEGKNEWISFWKK